MWPCAGIKERIHSRASIVAAIAELLPRGTASEREGAAPHGGPGTCRNCRSIVPFGPNSVSVLSRLLCSVPSREAVPVAPSTACGLPYSQDALTKDAEGATSESWGR